MFLFKVKLIFIIQKLGPRPLKLGFLCLFELGCSNLYKQKGDYFLCIKVSY